VQAKAKQVKYCLPGDRLTIDGVTGVRVHVLGPPHDEAKLKKDLPTKIRGRRGGRRPIHRNGTFPQALRAVIRSQPGARRHLTDAVKYPAISATRSISTNAKRFDFAFPEDEQFEQFQEGRDNYWRDLF